MGRQNLFFNATRDLVVLAAIVAVVNFLLGRDDPGWINMNPTPWLLPAVLVGARYGFAGGFIGGLAVAALIAGVKARMEGLALDELLHDHAYFFISIVVTGAAAGEIGRVLARRRAAIEEANRKLDGENARLRHQLHVTDETRHQLQEQLALLNAPLCALDEELARLFTHPQAEFAEQLLRVLHRLTSVTSAGVYLVDRGTLIRTAALHPTPPLAPLLMLPSTPLADSALTSGVMASVADAMELTQAQPFLAALPWLDHVGMTNVLLIQDMPFAEFTLRNLARVELIISWASAIAVLRRTFVNPKGQVHTATNEDFHVLLSEALAAERIHRLPSAVLRFDFDSASSLRAALRMLPDTAVATRLSGRHSLAVLLPFSGETEALRLRRDVATAQPGAKIQHYLMTGGVSASDLWATLQRS